jgi:uncharacterized protein (TIGR02147 family)
MERTSKKSRGPRPRIFKYHDYRTYLKDLLSHFKSKSDGPSLRDLAKTCGVTAGFLSLVMNGHKALSEKVMGDLVNHLGLNEDEKSYFRLLRTIVDSDKIEERQAAFNELQKFKTYKKLNPAESEVFKYLTHWHFVAIREMAALPGFKLESRWIKERLCFPLSQKEIEQAIRFLTKYDYIRVGADGSVKLTEKNIRCEGGVYRMALGRYYQQIYSLASESIERTAREQRCILGDTVAIPLESFHEFKRILEDCLEKIVRLENSKEGPNAVYHIGFMGFPLAKERDQS